MTAVPRPNIVPLPVFNRAAREDAGLKLGAAGGVKNVGGTLALLK